MARRSTPLPARGHLPRGAAPITLTVDARRPSGTTLSAGLFGVGVDYPVATYRSPSGPRCLPLPDVGASVSLVRIGADTADNYD